MKKAEGREPGVHRDVRIAPQTHGKIPLGAPLLLDLNCGSQGWAVPASPQPGPGTNCSCLPITQNSEENDEWPQVTEG